MGAVNKPGREMRKKSEAKQAKKLSRAIAEMARLAAGAACWVAVKE